MEIAQTDNVFAERLKQARRMRGWSLAELREQIGGLVSIAALSKYEKGQTMASSRVLVSLAEALEVSLDYLFRDFTVELERIRFRKLSSMQKKAVDQTVEQAREFFERYFEIEEIVGAVQPYESVFRPGQQGDPEELALRVREKWNVGNDPIPNVHALLEDHGIKLWFADDCDKRFDGFSAHTDRGPVAVVARHLPAVRKRMTALHEAAHILLEPLGMDPKEEEKFVPGFTGALLLPADSLKAILGTKRKTISFPELLEIKKRYGISMSGVMMRARDLGIITGDEVTTFFRFRAGKKWRSEKKEPWDEEAGQVFPETNHRFRQLVFRAHAEEAISTSQAASYLGLSVEEVSRLLNDPASSPR